MFVNLCDCLTRTACRLTDAELATALACAEKCAVLATRTRREAALLRTRCIRLELERRKLAATATLATGTPATAVR